ncbi:MAG TPA: PAS domain S-box protein [Gemmatimonadaceae bacterium]|jgi:PAS domain S-box-containing protein|nr:PAS domain S-box protein [Gemmatimonadaceae bacterium]
MTLVAFWQPMRRRLPLLVTALLAVAIGACCTLAYRQLAGALIVAAGERVTSVSTRLAAALAESETRVKTDKRRPHADSSFRAFLARRDARTEQLAGEALDRYRATNDGIVAVELWDRRGSRLLVSARRGFVAGRIGEGPATSVFASNGMVGPFLTAGDTIYTETRAPVLAGDDTIAIVRQLQRVEDTGSGGLVRNLIGSDALLLIGNATGDVWSDLSRRRPPPPGTPRVGAAVEATSADGRRWLGATAAVSRIPWLVWVGLPRDTVLAPAHAMLRTLAIVAVIILSGGAFIAWLIGRHLARPLSELTDAVGDIASGDYSRRVSVGGQSEVGRLAVAFNTMTAQIETSTAKLRTIVEDSPLGICTLDPDGIIQSWNSAAERMFGWTATEVVGRSGPSVMGAHPLLLEETRVRLLSGEHVSGLSVKRLRKNGTSIAVSLSGAALHDSSGAPIGLLVMFADVTEANTMQEQLATERKFLRQVIDINPNFLFAKDREGRFTLVNQATADAYGCTTDELLGKTDADFNSNTDEVDGYRLADIEVFEYGMTKVVSEERITDSTGKVRWLHTVKRPMRGEDGRIDQLLGVSTDITTRKHLEEQLLQSQKMEAVGQLAGGVAHDFNNVLTAIKGFGELAIEQLEDEHPVRGDIREICVAADRAAALTQQLLAFSRRQLLVPVLLSPNTVVDGISKLLARLIGAEVQCEARLSPDVGLVRADRGQLEQVLMNLAVNARDAMPNGGTLTIETANVTLDAAAAAHLSLVETIQPGRYVMLSVSDTGIGMSRSTLSSIFEPFFTTKEPGKGTGLGLSTVYGIVRQSGGHVHVYSELGHGTVFKLFLPCAHGEIVAALAAPQDSEISQVTETVLVVDDDDGVRITTSRILTRAGYDVLSAASPAEAEAVWTSYEGPIHLLLTDVMMPSMDGGELARRLLATRPDARVLYTSGYTNESVVGRGLITPDTAFLAKPFTIEAIVRKTREALAWRPVEVA